MNMMVKRDGAYYCIHGTEETPSPFSEHPGVTMRFESGKYELKRILADNMGSLKLFSGEPKIPVYIEGALFFCPKCRQVYFISREIG